MSDTSRVNKNNPIDFLDDMYDTMFNPQIQAKKMINTWVVDELYYPGFKKFLKLCPKPDVLVIFDEKKKITNFLKNSKKISFKKKTFLQNYKFLKENIKKSFRGTLIISSKDKKTLEILKHLNLEFT